MLDIGGKDLGDTFGATGNVGKVTSLQLRHAATFRIDQNGLDALLGQDSSGGERRVRLIVVDEAGGIERDLALAEGWTCGVRRNRGFEQVGCCLGMVLRKLHLSINLGDGVEQFAQGGILAGGRPVGEARDGLDHLAVSVGHTELIANEVLLPGPALGRAITQDQVGDVDIEFVRRHVGTLGQETHVA